MASVGGYDDFVMLERRDQLELLALTLRNREERMISTSKSFVTEKDRVNYLKSVNKAFAQTTDLLRACSHLKQRCSQLTMEDTKRSRASSIVHDIHEYIHFAVNLSLQGFRNCTVRSDYLSKLRRHFNALAKEVESQDFAVEEGGVLKLIEEAKACKEAMWMYANRYRSAGGRAMAEAYRCIIKQKGLTVADVVKSHQNKLGFEGEFESLEEKEQLQVYNSIIEEALGESYGFLDKVALVGGPAVFLTTAGLMAYDIITADNHAEAALHDGLDLFNMISGFALQVTVELEATQILTAMEMGALVVSLGAFVLGVAAGFIFCAVAGRLIDQAIRGGGTKAPKLEGLTFHKITAPPDGREIANEIARGGY